MPAYDALLLIAFGGPEQTADVIPFLENVLRGRNVPRKRMLEVAQHYYHFGGISPINGQMRDLIPLLDAELRARGPQMPVYWGNRNWHPMLADTLRRMQTAGVRRAAAFVMSAYSSYSGCRQYLEDIARARMIVSDRFKEGDRIVTDTFVGSPTQIHGSFGRSCDPDKFMRLIKEDAKGTPHRRVLLTTVQFPPEQRAQFDEIVDIDVTAQTETLL